MCLEGGLGRTTPLRIIDLSSGALADAIGPTE
jgi:hypothetical protein